MEPVVHCNPDYRKGQVLPHLFSLHFPLSCGRIQHQTGSQSKARFCALSTHHLA
jgi:hypothetical protein